MKNGTTITRGRGSNPISRSNLALGNAARNWYVYGRGSGIGWSKLFGPYFQSKAQEIVSRLEKLNATGSPMYVASTTEQQ